MSDVLSADQAVGLRGMADYCKLSVMLSVMYAALGAATTGDLCQVWQQLHGDIDDIRQGCIVWPSMGAAHLLPWWRHLQATKR